VSGAASYNENKSASGDATDNENKSALLSTAPYWNTPAIRGKMVLAAMMILSERGANPAAKHS
jgi:hypothetical protein